MSFLPNAILPAWLIDSLSLVQIANFKPAHQQSRNWQNLLGSVHNNQLEFVIKWIEIHKPSGGHFIKSHPIDNPYPIQAPLPTPMIYLPTKEEEKELRKRGITDFRTPLEVYTEDYAFDLRIFISSSPKIYWLSNTNDVKILDELVQLLDVPDRAWAANVILAKMMGSTGLSFEIREGKAEQWWETEGKTGKAKQEWDAYLKKVKPTLKWSILGGYYKHITPGGEKVL